MPIPRISTRRLILRPFTPLDASAVQELAGAREVAETTLTIPHPYEDGAAEAWIGQHEADWDAGKSLVLAITTEADGVVGATGLSIVLAHRRAELGYWIGVPFWNLGYATEAARAMVTYGFDALGLNRIEAHVLTTNPASGRVLAKVGMQQEGIRRQFIVKWDSVLDVSLHAIVASDRAGEASRG